MTVVTVTVVTVTVVTVTVVKFVTVVIVKIATVALVRFFSSQFEFLSFVAPQHLDNRPLSGQLFAILAMFLRHHYQFTTGSRGLKLCNVSAILATP